MNTAPTISLTVTSPPQSFEEPISISEMVSYLKIPGTTGTEFELIASLIQAARADAERLQNRELVRKQLDWVADYWTSCEIPLPFPLISVDLVQYRDSDGTTHDLTADVDYVVNTSKGVIVPKSGDWPSFNAWPSGAVLIRCAVGYEATDPWWSADGGPVKDGMRLRISDQFYDRAPKVINGIDSAEWAMRKGARPSAF